MSSEWRTAEDVEKDIWSFSENSEHDDVHESVPEPILQWNARIGQNHNVGIFDSDLPFDEVTHIISGRGRGCITQIYKAGVQMNVGLDDEDDIRRRLREVSGLGYSNELIEKEFKKKIPSVTNENEFCDVPEEEDYSRLGFINLSSSNNNGSASPRPLTKNDASSGSSQSLLSSASSPSGEIKESQEPIPPLSLMLKRAKKKVDKKITNAEKEVTKEKSPNQRGKKFALRPEAPEFQVEPKKVISPIHKPVDDVEGWGRTDVNQRSELSWRKREKPTSYDKRDHYQSRAGVSWRTSGNETDKSYENSYRQAAMTRNSFNRNFTKKDKKLFNINSANDFPNL